MPKELTLQGTDDVRARLDRLQRLSGASSLGEVFQWSLAVYDLLLTAEETGKVPLLRDAFGNLEQVGLRGRIE